MGFFISVEGVEGVGKSTAIKFIENFLAIHKINFVISREPGGTAIAEKIRQVLLYPDTDEKLFADTELLLMFAARKQHIEEIILPALKDEKWVICDRYVDASYAYQGGGREINLATIKFLDQWIVNGLLPDLTILLDAPPEIGLSRAKNRGPHDRIESETLAFFERVRLGYLERAKNDTNRFRMIDASQSLEIVHQKLEEILCQILSSHGKKQIGNK